MSAGAGGKSHPLPVKAKSAHAQASAGASDVQKLLMQQAAALRNVRQGDATAVRVVCWPEPWTRWISGKIEPSATTIENATYAFSDADAQGCRYLC